MDRLAYVIIFTGDMAGMRRFYEDGVGLVAREHSPEWVEYDTSGATLALHAMPDPGRRGVQLRFATGDIETRVKELSGLGARFEPPQIERFPWGKLAYLWDPEDNHLTLWKPSEPHDPGPGPGAGPGLSAVVNCLDMDAQKRYYRDTLGFAATFESSSWVRLATGDAGLGLHSQTGGAVRTGSHHGRGITIGLAVPDLTAWLEESAVRGLSFTSPPSDRGFGTFTAAADPDGNPVTFREAPEPETLEEQLAEPFEDDGAPGRTAIRKPVSKRAKATSRVATRPQYRAAKPAAKRRRVSKKPASVASPRGTGPAGTRKKPKRKHDPKRAGTKPATGRRKKAERRTFKSQKQAIAGASRRKPVKRASRARPKKRGVARRGSAKR